jgi:hypothetical protein
VVACHHHLDCVISILFVQRRNEIADKRERAKEAVVRAQAERQAACTKRGRWRTSPTILHRAFRDAIRWQALVRNPCESADPPRPSAKPEMKTWTAAQLSVFLQHVAVDRLVGAWWLAASTGMPAVRCSAYAGPTSTSRPDA